MNPLPYDAPILLTIHYNLLLIIVVVTSFWCYFREKDTLKASLNYTVSFTLSFILIICLTLFWGLRGHHGFGDTGYYVYLYENLYNDYLTPSINNEWLWNNFSHFLKEIGFSTADYLIVVEALYIGGMFFCCFRLMRNNIWIAILFFVCSLSFLSYGINGIRNGLACSIMLIGITSITDRRLILRVLSIGLIFLSVGIHASVIVPAICCIASLLIVRDVRIALLFWVISIGVSFFAGNNLLDFFAGLGFDDRASKYLINVEDSEMAELFSSTGFRWDFIIYSMVPIYFVYYLKVKRNFQDRVFDVIANTYILANAFWIMVIQASYSNRFAYLSWFMYPLVIAYPLLRFSIWDNQNKITGLILFFYYGFTYLMQLIGH